MSKTYMLMGNYNGKAPQIFTTPLNSTLITTSAYGGNGYISNYRQLPITYSTLGDSYQVLNNGKMSDQCSALNVTDAYKTMIYGPTQIIQSPYYARAQCQRNALYE